MQFINDQKCTECGKVFTQLDEVSICHACYIKKNIIDTSKDFVLNFRGVDSWNRPIFERNKKFYGDTCNLFAYDASSFQVLEFYKQNPQMIANISYFGEYFGCEPSGGTLRKDLKIVLTERK